MRFYLLTGAVLSGTLGLSMFTEIRRPDSLTHHLETVPMDVGGWSGTKGSEISDAVQSKLLATEHLSRIYHRDNRVVDLWIAYYAQQKAGESMHSPKNCLPGAGWEALEAGIVDVSVPGREPIKVNDYLIAKDGVRAHVLYWYQSKQRIFPSEYAGKVFLAWDSLLGRSTGGTLVRVSVPDQQGALNDAKTFAGEVIPLVDRCLR